MNRFNCNENKSLLWDMLVTNKVFNNVPNNNFSDVKMMFENIINNINRGIDQEIGNEKLLELNKNVIVQVRQGVNIFKSINNETTFDNEKILVFDKNLETAQQNFETLINPAPEFKLQEEHRLMPIIWMRC